jgi:hypothetical protein
MAHENPWVEDTGPAFEDSYSKKVLESTIRDIKGIQARFPLKKSEGYFTAFFAKKPTPTPQESQHELMHNIITSLLDLVSEIQTTVLPCFNNRHMPNTTELTFAGAKFATFNLLASRRVKNWCLELSTLSAQMEKDGIKHHDMYQETLGVVANLVIEAEKITELKGAFPFLSSTLFTDKDWEMSQKVFENIRQKAKAELVRAVVPAEAVEAVEAVKAADDADDADNADNADQNTVKVHCGYAT